ncbi:MAG: 4-hydroxy-tetrahydrodipicolinate synthase [Bacillota bacterium]|jgi:4-hydroxy-tetrahydrodipicolinate synthase|nr:4-hydroxy-tetrahydrodipicolinate synthase [Bacillota bacterium]HOB91046.1 4-hydroxy-tetrahydrodipicolinate synthase [Bacillota bacterium]HPZ54172.1 4-hydroxy-tetrahydrodipicolinate synthase [Bacillota bacterium]HQD18094.1 4-hydroxy-tetrahydrodipicolinate synthase [Bacillota bacterium]
MADFGALLVAMVTPMNKDMSVDIAGARELARRLVDDGCDGLVVSGSTGESSALTDSEKVALFEAVVEEVGGKAAVIAGTGTYCTAQSIELTRSAERVGVDGIMLVTPYYNKPPQRALVEHFSSIAASTSLPVILYNVPSRTACNMAPETVAELSRIKNIAGIKEASGDMTQVSWIRAMTSSDFAIYSGNDADTLPVLALGGRGVISVAGNLVSRTMKAMIESFEAGNTPKARDLHLKLLPLFEALFVESNPIPVKYAMSLLGMPAGPLRLPLVEISDAAAKEVRDALSGLGLI